MTFSPLFRSLAILIVVLALPAAAGAQRYNTEAEYAILVEVETGAVLFEKNADTPFPPASMSKLMTTYLVFEMIKNGEVSLDDTIEVATDTWRKWRLQGSTMFLNAGQEVTVSDLLRGIIVQSGNDACVVLAEGVAGTEAGYVQWMNDKADEIGLLDSHFTNTTGWPDENHVMSARDLARLAQMMIQGFPELYQIYSERSFTYGTDPTTGRPITQSNRNPLLYGVEGGDGLKTGHTEESGYGLTGSALRDGRRLIMVVGGLPSISSRAKEARSLINWGFRNFKTYDLFAAGDVVADADVWLGKRGSLPLTVESDVRLTLSRSERNRMIVKLAYDNPVPAPIVQGQPLATVTIALPDKDAIEIPLVAGRAVERVSGFGRLAAAFEYLLFGSASN